MRRFSLVLYVGFMVSIVGVAIAGGFDNYSRSERYYLLTDIALVALLLSEITAFIYVREFKRKLNLSTVNTLFAFLTLSFSNIIGYMFIEYCVLSDNDRSIRRFLSINANK
jgi:drug/metabolite transporter (DMT)-like permease